MSKETDFDLRDLRTWKKVEMCGYLLTSLALPVNFYFGMMHFEGRVQEMPIWVWVVTLGLWYTGFIVSGFAKYKQQDYTGISIFFTVLGLVAPLVIYYLRSL